ncbi:MAG: sodium-dependent transporter [Cytophagales bacterium]|nr:sodium-dependent transporter [Cytophagales bacterium]
MVDFWDNLIFSFCFMGITAVIVLKGVQKGIEAASKIMMPTLFFILIALIIYSLTLAKCRCKALVFICCRDLTKINFQTIYSALGQAFFSLSLGMGALITYGSYVEKNQNILGSAATITLMDMSVAFPFGFTDFSLWSFHKVNHLRKALHLVFVVLPGIFNTMGPILGRIIGGGFFLLLCFAALTSTISLLEVPVAYFVDQKRWSRMRTTWFLAALIFVIGLPSMLSQGAVEMFSSLSFYQGKSST